jgi:hypothetical protein
MILYCQLSREIEFPGKWESLGQGRAAFVFVPHTRKRKTYHYFPSPPPPRISFESFVIPVVLWLRSKSDWIERLTLGPITESTIATSFFRESQEQRRLSKCCTRLSRQRATSGGRRHSRRQQERLPSRMLPCLLLLPQRTPRPQIEMMPIIRARKRQERRPRLKRTTPRDEDEVGEVARRQTRAGGGRARRRQRNPKGWGGF